MIATRFKVVSYEKPNGVENVLVGCWSDVRSRPNGEQFMTARRRPLPTEALEASRYGQPADSFSTEKSSSKRKFFGDFIGSPT